MLSTIEAKTLNSYNIYYTSLTSGIEKTKKLNKKIGYILFLLFPGILLSISPACRKTTGTHSRLLPADSITAQKAVHTKYGISYDSLNVLEGTVKRNQNLSEILHAYDISFQTLGRLSNVSKPVFDIRKIRRGNPYTLFYSRNNSKTARYFVYEHTPVEYFIFDLTDSLRVIRKEKEIKSEQKTAYGIISTSLWHTINEKKLNLALVNELSDIFAWSIDFFGLQQGDFFKVIYEEQFVDSTSFGLGKIYTAYFNHAGEDFYAIPFIQDGSESFYDRNGNSLRKAFLKAPLRFSRISSMYSYSRMHPILKIRRPHFGVDYAAPIGTPVHAIGDGKIIKTGWNGEAGRMVKIKHNSVYTTAYLHLSRYGKGVKSGKYVKQGDIIGYVGSTGLSTGPHLDFRFYKNGHPIDPLKVKTPPVNPVKKENLAKFNKIKNVMVTLINTVQ